MSDDGLCHCTGRMTGYTRDITVEFEYWVCGICRNPTRLYLEKLYERLENED